MRKIILSGCALLLVSACSTDPNRGGYYQDDGPHNQPHVNVDTIANAIPRSEPLSKSGNSPYVVFGKEYTPMARTGLQGARRRVLVRQKVSWKQHFQWRPLRYVRDDRRP